MNDNYKIAHEEFIKYLNGSSPEEVLGVTLIAPASTAFFISLLALPLPFSTSISTYSWRVQVVLEYIGLVLPLLLVLTLWNEYIYTLLFTLLLACVFTLLIKWIITDKNAKFQCIKKSDICDSCNFQSKCEIMPNCNIPSSSTNLPFLSTYRSQLLQATAISILGVDFPVFPRRFAKTESYGWSVMDLGVGSFVLANALVSSHSKGRMFKHRANHILHSLISSSPLLLLGIGRLAVVKAVKYPEHVTEYGVHWNFFFTLALTKIACTVLLSLVPPSSSALSAVLIGVFYQILLSYGHFNQYLLNDTRENLIASNKEGLFSLFGYMALYLIGVQLGKFILIKRCSLQEWLKCSATLFSVGACAWIFMSLASESIEPVSRRIANLSYCLWINLLNTLVMEGRDPLYPSNSQSSKKDCEGLEDSEAYRSPIYSPDRVLL